MRLLITNSQEMQAYTILRSLRAEAERVVITWGGESVRSSGSPGMAIYSRFVDSKYEVPAFAEDWLAGRLAPDNTRAEEIYIQRIEQICDEESIDVIFPSLDPEVYLFAKNKNRFLAQGITTVVPDPEVIRIPMDKARTVRAALRTGFPCPRTFFPESVADLGDIRGASEPPWIVKPRLTAHGAHMELVESVPDLETAFERVSSFQPAPLVQELVGGSKRQNYYVTLNREGEILSLFAPEVKRTAQEGYRVRCKTCISGSTAPYLDELRALLNDLRLWGGYTVQTHIDPRDGTPKLLEINPRLGHHVWWRTALGVNEPLILLQLARGETPIGNFEFPSGVTLLDPYHDVFSLYSKLIRATFRVASRLRRIGRGRSDCPDQPEPPLAFLRTLRVCAREYLNLKPKRYGPEVANIFVDPYACFRVFWDKFWAMTASAGRRALPSFRRRRGSPLV